MPNPQGDASPTRRRFVTAGTAVAAASLAGCTAVNFVRGEARFAADPVIVSEETLNDTGYQETRVREQEVTRTFEAVGQRRDVTVVNVIAEYARTLNLLGVEIPGAVFLVLATPKVRVLGQTFNPVGRMTPSEFAETLGQQFDTITNVTPASQAEYTTPVGGRDTAVGRYDADASLADLGISTDIRLEITEPVALGDDFVVCLAAYPRVIDEGDAVAMLLEGVTGETSNT